MSNAIQCVSCGRFIAYKEMVEGGGAEFYFEPDNHFSQERCEWTCKKCALKEKAEQPTQEQRSEHVK